MSLFTLLVKYISILISVTLLCKEVGGFDYKLYEEPCPFWCRSDSQYLLLLSSLAVALKKKGAELLIVLCFFQTRYHCNTSATSLSCLVAEKSYMILSKIPTSLLENSYWQCSHKSLSLFFPPHLLAFCTSPCNS